MSISYLSKKEAEELSGIKLDGRKKYFLWNGLVCNEVKFKRVCSGCSDCGEYFSSSVGFGCSECGYHGVRIDSYPCPANPKQVK